MDERSRAGRPHGFAERLLHTLTFGACASTRAETSAITFVSIGMAIETGVETGTLVIADHTATIDHCVTNIYRRLNGEWKLVHHHTDQSRSMLDILKRLNEAA